MTVRIAPSIDLANPPSGVRLEISVIATEVGVSMKQMADACGISKTAISDLVCSNVWPARTPREQIETALLELFRSKGADEEQLAKLFHAHTRSRTNGGPKGHAQPRGGYVAPISEPDPAQPRRPAKERKAANTTDEVTDVLLAKQTLSPEARKAFGLFTNPFDGEVESADQMYSNGEIRFVREACWQAAINSRFVGVTGESGAGKSTLIADLKERIATDRRPIIMIEPSVVGMEESDAKGKPLTALDILTALVMTLNPLAAVAQTMEKRTRQVAQMLADSTSAGNSHLLLIEEAHKLPTATFPHLKRIHERMRLNGRKPMLGILLIGQPELRMKLEKNSHSLREVVQRIELVDLPPLNHDLKTYLQHRAKSAGHDLSKLVTDDGVEAIRQRLIVLPEGARNQAVSLVYPLAVNNLVTACLNKAAGLGAPIVTGDVVREI